MSKTIKIIDLLVRMHKKENLPRKIEISGEEYLYDNISETYVSTLNNQYLGHEISLDFCLNDKIVIIEEQEEIDIQEINLDFARLSQFPIKNSKGQEEILEVLFVEIQEKMKELARKINYLDKNIKEKQ